MHIQVSSLQHIYYTTYKVFTQNEEKNSAKEANSQTKWSIYKQEAKMLEHGDKK